MNTKFFDLKKEKQDRIINGSLKIFCRYGYRHASTDEIVAEAGISKGLLFHYFISKKGLYRFLYDYCSHYMLDELRRGGAQQGGDYLDVQEKLARTESGVMRIYPCMPLFLHCADLESDSEANSALEGLALLGAVQKCCGSLPGDPPAGLTASDLPQLTQLLAYYREGLARDMLRTDTFDADTFLAECSSHIAIFRKMGAAIR